MGQGDILMAARTREEELVTCCDVGPHALYCEACLRHLVREEVQRMIDEGYLFPAEETA